MRRVVPMVVLPVLLVAGCGGGSDSDIEVTGEVGKQPHVAIPEGQPGGELEVDAVHEGEGSEIAEGDLIIANYIGYVWSGDQNRIAGNSYGEGQPAAFPSGRMISGLDKGLTGQRVGSRVLLEIPPKEGFGDEGNQQQNVTADDTLVYVVDVLDKYSKSDGAEGSTRQVGDRRLPAVRPGGAGSAPSVQVPESSPPNKLRVETLVEGGGPEVEKGQLLVTQYEGKIWRGGKTFDSSWENGQPAAFEIGAEQVIEGWDRGLVGKPVGSRVLLSVPPEQGYGSKGLEQAGIKASDTLVFVIDILGAH